jgi:Tfp pilus assembly protein PilF
MFCDINKADARSSPISLTKALTLACLALGPAACGFVGETPVAGMVVKGDEAADSGESAYIEGKRNLLAGNYGLAVRQFRAALRQRPNSPDLLNAMAVAYEHLGRQDVSQSYFALALAIDPNSVQTLNNVGHSLMKSGATTLAGSYLERAAFIDPKNSVVQSNIEKLAGEIRAKSRQSTAAAAAEDEAAALWIERTDQYVQTLVTQRESAWTTEAPLAPTRVETASAILQATLPPPPMARTSHLLPVEAAMSRPAPSIAIANGNGRTRMAARVGVYLQEKGWAASRLLNADHFRYAKTAILHRPGFSTQAHSLAAALPLEATVEESQDVPADVLIRIGRDLIPFDGRISSSQSVRKEHHDSPPHS